MVIVIITLVSISRCYCHCTNSNVFWYWYLTFVSARPVYLHSHLQFINLCLMNCRWLMVCSRNNSLNQTYLAAQRWERLSYNVLDLSSRLRHYETLHHSDFIGSSNAHRVKRESSDHHNKLNAIEEISVTTLGRFVCCFCCAFCSIYKGPQ